MENFLSKIKELELNTDSGKINYRWGLILTCLVAALTAKDWVLSIVALIISAVKTWILSTNIKEEVETANVFFLVIIVIFFFILCIELLFYEDKKKREIKEEAPNK